MTEPATGPWLPEAPTAAGRLLDLVTAYYASNAVHAAAELRLADHLADAGTAGELAAATGADAGALERLLRLLAAYGVLTQPEPGRFALTEVGQHLRADAAVSLRDVALQFAGAWQQRTWTELAHSVRTGTSAFEHTTGSTVFAHLAANPDLAEVFDRSMAFFAGGISEAVVDAYDFGRFATVADVGGGYGSLLAAVLRANPGVRGLLVDLAHVVSVAAVRLARSDVASRCETVAADFFESVPAGGDCYLLKNVVHDWDDGRAVTILRHCRSVVPPDGRLVLVEMVQPEQVDGSVESRWSTGSDVNMLVHLGGRERTESDFRSLLAASGFALTRCVGVRPAWSGVALSRVLEGTPV